MKIDRAVLLEEVRVDYLKRLKEDVRKHLHYRDSLQEYTHVDPTKLIEEADREIARLVAYIARIEAE